MSSIKLYYYVFGALSCIITPVPPVDCGIGVKRDKEELFDRKRRCSSHPAKLVDGGAQRAARHHFWAHCTLLS